MTFGCKAYASAISLLFGLYCSRLSSRLYSLREILVPLSYIYLSSTRYCKRVPAAWRGL